MESSSPEIDLRLLQRITTGDETALAELYDRHSRLAYSVIIRILGRPADADDVLQETFVRVWSRAETYDARLGSPATWLTGIARNRAVDRLRAIEDAATPAVRAGDEPITRDTPETVLEDRTVAVPSMDPPAHVRERLLAAVHAPGRYTLWAADAAWIDTGLPGISARVLSVDKARSRVTLLIRAEPGAVYPPHRHHGPEECYVMNGSVMIDNRVLRAGDFHHADADSEHGEIRTIDGADVLIVGAIEDYLPWGW